ncbi:MAG TPA: hypothetical protein VD793_08770 [Gemmatimonadales bacterium]|nr:hypothetical protein [Gemmatimonadales bacterium]
MDLTAQAVFAAGRTSPVPGGGHRTEATLEQPLMLSHARLAGGALRVDLAINLEGLTMPAGVPGLGAWGEGYVDRRHPHTYLHELMVSVAHGMSPGLRVSAAAGKGFVAFGTDDPMNRPALRFPVNHHWAQVLERAVIQGAVRVERVALEGSLFNGDEPERPAQWPNLSRLGDSWSGRLTVWPGMGVKAQVSHARVASPEHRGGAGPRADKWSASASFSRTAAPGSVYLLAEWARTSEAGGFFVFDSWLGEVEAVRAPHRVYLRGERTRRPEESRTLNLTRTVRPHVDDALLGITRWSVGTVGYGATVALPTVPLTVEPLMEVSLARAETLTGVFSVEDFYGRTSFGSVTLGLRVRHGPAHVMGRYGVMRDVEH